MVYGQALKADTMCTDERLSDRPASIACSSGSFLRGRAAHTAIEPKTVVDYDATARTAP
jgi:hypothetical protein